MEHVRTIHRWEVEIHNRITKMITCVVSGGRGEGLKSCCCFGLPRPDRLQRMTFTNTNIIATVVVVVLHLVYDTSEGFCVCCSLDPHDAILSIINSIIFHDVGSSHWCPDRNRIQECEVPGVLCRSRHLL